MEKKMELKILMEKMIKVNASDLHLKAGAPPVFRIDGKLAEEKGLGISNLKEIKVLGEKIDNVKKKFKN